MAKRVYYAALMQNNNMHMGKVMLSNKIEYWSLE